MSLSCVRSAGSVEAANWWTAEDIYRYVSLAFAAVVASTLGAVMREEACATLTNPNQLGLLRYADPSCTF